MIQERYFAVDFFFFFLLLLLPLLPPPPLLLLLLTSIELSRGGSSPYTSTNKTNKNKIYINETIQ